MNRCVIYFDLITASKTCSTYNYRKFTQLWCECWSISLIEIPVSVFSHNVLSRKSVFLLYKFMTLGRHFVANLMRCTCSVRISYCKNHLLKYLANNVNNCLFKRNKNVDAHSPKPLFNSHHLLNPLVFYSTTFKVKLGLTLQVDLPH